MTTTQNPIATIADMVREAEKHANDMSKDRIRAIEYYDGTMTDTPSDPGRSKQVSRDVRSQIKKVLPSIMRTILGSEQVVEYQPVGSDDEEAASQSSDYINQVVSPDVNLRRHIEDALHDALQLRNGILKWWWEEKQCIRSSSHSGLTEDELTQLISDDAVEVLEHSEREEQTDIGPVTLHDVEIRRSEMEGKPRIACVPRERFLIHPDATSLEDSALTGEKTTLTRSDLVAMGYDRELVDSLSVAGEDDEEESIRRDAALDADEAHRANEPVDYYDIYVRFDADGDGVAELRHMCFAGGLAEKNLLMDEECDEVQFADIKVMSRPHQWEGISLSDDLMDIQRVKTVLLRQTLDNLYWQNNPQPLMQEGAVKNPEAVYNPEFGLPIKVRDGTDVRSAMGFNQVPFVAQQSFGMLEYLDQDAQDRTGVSDASAGLAPDALQNMTATASAMINQAGIGQTEMMVRTAAEGLRTFFRGLLRLTVRHQDKERTVRLRGEWVTFDPRHWNANMDCIVNVGLGAGTRERDMQIMQMVMGLHEKLLASFGVDNPYVSPENLWEALSRMVEAAGLRTPELYFTQPDPEAVKAKIAESANQPSPEMMKMQAQAQAEQAKHQLETQKMQAEFQLKREQMQAEMTLKREQMAAEIKLKREQMQIEMAMGRTGGSPDLGGTVRMGGQVG